MALISLAFSPNSAPAPVSTRGIQLLWPTIWALFTSMDHSMDAYLNTGKQAARSGGIAGRKDYGRSRVSNGSKTLPETDGRLRVSRRFRDIANFILVDQGGIDACSESRKQLIRRFAAAAVLAEQMEAKLCSGEEIDVNTHALLCSTLTRLASRIGLDRIPKDVLSLDQYLSRQAAE